MALLADVLLHAAGLNVVLLLPRQRMRRAQERRARGPHRRRRWWAVAAGALESALDRLSSQTEVGAFSSVLVAVVATSGLRRQLGQLELRVILCRADGRASCEFNLPSNP